MTGVPVAPTGPHTAAVKAAIEARGVLVGRGEIPPGGGWQSEPGASAYVPYVVLWPSPGDSSEASLAEPYGYLDYKFQVTAYASTQEGVETVMDQVRAALVGVRLTVPNRSTYPVQLTLGRPTDRVDTVTPALHVGVAQFEMRSEAA
ncbi:uncharacterized protein DUF3168 [Actinocorallia herbida]|uniref:Uncharacterized protein DUF3168 n=1 Tax=Actinocorallia herbida TaxID=58109 RepID=A0A3N1CMP8_9ACTN|nr:hypothetical protein [Actinocorallia herbida]ROO82580.1 uncharacterized protein DUF3168 [Actinocorallia herbida]